MRTDENFFPMPVIKAAHPLMADTRSDTQCERFPIESDDHHPALPNATVMMVDDEPTTIEILETFLQGEGYDRFVTTTDSRQAVALARQEGLDAFNGAASNLEELAKLHKWSEIEATLEALHDLTDRIQIPVFDEKDLPVDREEST